MKSLVTISLLSLVMISTAQVDRWQQRAEYEMNINMVEENHQYNGDMELTYYNNSPEALDRVFFHLYFNAFRPGSMMDVRSLNIEDPDPRVGDRISNLTPDEEGWIRVSELTMGGQPCEFIEEGTILAVTLPKTIQSGAKAKFSMKWDAQVPLQVRRSGWNNSEGIEFSMTQWYPKMCEYDFEGWHANPYIGREFHGVWSDFNVNITMGGKYMIGGTGELQNPKDVGYTNDDLTQRVAPRGRVTWEFEAENVIDFAWAADPDYISSMAKLDNGTKLYFIHQDDVEINDNWRELEKFMVDGFEFMNEKFGEYPYSQYTFIQGGDGGMEYPMTTLITGNRSLKSLVSVSVHEAAHSWYQGVLATNEALYEWMDEGFTSFATSATMRKLFGDNGLPTHHYSYQGYLNIVREGKEEALSTHADHYNTNYAYGTAAYSKGQVLLAQLGYIIGEENRNQGLLTYFDTWKFKHPNSNDFKRIMELQSGMELDWYFEYFENTTHTIDYSISQVLGKDGKVQVTLSRVGIMPMPVDVSVTYQDGSTETYTIPLRIMRGSKSADEGFTVAEDWPWTNPEYILTLDKHIKEIASIEIDSARGMADVDRSNNIFELQEGTEFIWKH